MKVLIANISAAPKDSETGRFINDIMAPVQLRNFQLSAEVGDEFTSRFPTTGFSNADFAANRYVTSINLDAVYDQVMQAEKEGFDGAIICCVFDPALDRTRRDAGIPVVGLCEATLALACLAGKRFGIISPTPLLTDPLLGTIARYGQSDRVVGVGVMNVPWPRQELAYFDSADVLEDFQAVAHPLVKKGAEVLIPLCGLLSPLVRMAPGPGRSLGDGITEVDGVPVADVMASGTSLLRALYGLKRSGAGWRNPRAFTDGEIPPAAPSDEARAPASAAPGFWDLSA